MKWYYKKSEILREMWKDPKDIRLLARMIARWEIIEEWNKWRFSSEGENVTVDTEVDKKLILLEQENRKLKKENEELMQALAETESSSTWLLDIDNLKYLMDMLQARNRFIAAVIKDFFDSNHGKYDREDSIKEVYKKYHFEERAEDEDVIWYVLDIIKDNSKKSEITQ